MLLEALAFEAKQQHLNGKREEFICYAQKFRFKKYLQGIVLFVLYNLHLY